MKGEARGRGHKLKTWRLIPCKKRNFDKNREVLLIECMIQKSSRSLYKLQKHSKFYINNYSDKNNKKFNKISTNYRYHQPNRVIFLLLRIVEYSSRKTVEPKLTINAGRAKEKKIPKAMIVIIMT